MEEAAKYETTTANDEPRAVLPQLIEFQLARSSEGWEVTIGSTTRIYPRLKAALAYVERCAAKLDGAEEKGESK